MSEKKAIIEYLYLDLNTCDRCIGTDKVLDEVMTVISPALEMAGYKVEYNKIEMNNEETARRFRLLSSPTIRVNGLDICRTVAENSCGCCSDISGTDVECRVFEYKGQRYEVPPKEMIAEAVFGTLFGGDKSVRFCGEYKLPENLREFYRGKENKACCSCGDKCC